MRRSLLSPLGLTRHAHPSNARRGESAPRADAPEGSHDFTSETEARRFRDLPPIAREEWQAVDWDDLARRLTG